MKIARNLLFGDITDFFQDSEVEDAQIAAEAAQSSASYASRQVAVVRQRLVEMERDNALLAAVLLHALRMLESSGVMSRDDFTASLRGELAKLREQKRTDFLNDFRAELGLPRQSRTEIAPHRPLPPAAPQAEDGSGVLKRVLATKPRTKPTGKAGQA